MRLLLIVFLFFVIYHTSQATLTREGIENVERDIKEFQEKKIIMGREGIQTTLPNLYDTNKQAANNHKCVYQLTMNGPEYVETEDVDLSEYYQVPVATNPGIDGLTLAQRKKQDTHFKDKEVSKVTSQKKLSEIYEANIYGTTVGDWKNIYGEGITPNPKTPFARRCFENEYLNVDNWTVARPDLNIYSTSKDSTETPLTGAIPPSEPLMPWLQDPSLKDKSARSYLREQEIPCQSCGKLLSPHDKSSIYPGTYDGPNKYKGFTLRE